MLLLLTIKIDSINQNKLRETTQTVFIDYVVDFIVCIIGHPIIDGIG